VSEYDLETSYICMYVNPSYVYELNVRTDVLEIISHARTEFCVYLLSERTLLLVLCDDSVTSLHSQFINP
jgi:hypothetical protein